jgi:MOSC domain-containing protein YiiM
VGRRIAFVRRNVNRAAVIRHIFVSPGHNFFGRHQLPAGAHAARDVASAIGRAGWGLEGDRFYGYRPEYKGQITFFAWETVVAARREFGVPALGADVFRRNVIVEGLDLAALFGVRFSLGGLVFDGIEESRPCHWMNQVVAPGAEDWLRGRGGLRAKIASDGELRVGPTELRLLQEATRRLPSLRKHPLSSIK